MKTLVVSGLLGIISALIGIVTLSAMEVNPTHNVAAQPTMPAAVRQQNTGGIESIRHSAKLINLGFSGTTL